MKFLLPLAVLAVSSVSFASTRNIYDIMYLPNAGTTYGFSEAEYVIGEYEVAGSKVDVDGYRLTQTFGHSFTDSFSFQGSLNYLNQESDAKGLGTSTNSGLSDPTFQGKYRFLDNNVLWDLLVGTTAGAKDAEIEVDGDSNNTDGSIKAFIGSQVGMKMGSFQWAALARFQHNFKSSIEVSGVASDAAAHNDYLLRVDGLYHMMKSCLIRGFVSGSLVEGHNSSVGNDTSAATTYRAGAEYQHVISQDLLLRAGADYSMTSYDADFYEDVTALNFTLGANYQF